MFMWFHKFATASTKTQLMACRRFEPIPGIKLLFVNENTNNGYRIVTADGLSQTGHRTSAATIRKYTTFAYQTSTGVNTEFLTITSILHHAHNHLIMNKGQIIKKKFNHTNCSMTNTLDWNTSLWRRTIHSFLTSITFLTQTQETRYTIVSLWHDMESTLNEQFHMRILHHCAVTRECLRLVAFDVSMSCHKGDWNNMLILKRWP